MEAHSHNRSRTLTYSRDVAQFYQVRNIKSGNQKKGARSLYSQIIGLCLVCMYQWVVVCVCECVALCVHHCVCASMSVLWAYVCVFQYHMSVSLSLCLLREK